MQVRELEASHQFDDVILRTPANLTAVGFLGGLGSLHLAIAIPGFMSGHWQAYLSLIFATIFLLSTLLCWRCRFELAVLSSQKRLRLRNGFGRLCTERFIPFSAVRGVRLTFEGSTSNPDAIIELLCPLEDIQCPPTTIPRQQALFLAMAMDVPLTKVSEAPPLASRIEYPDRPDSHSRISAN